jgi:hypothetical protein
MSAEPRGERVRFISTEQTDDLIVSFAIADPGIWGVISLTLLRTPKFEFALPEEETGVGVSHESYPETDMREILQRIRVAPPGIETTARRYELDVSHVEREQVQSALDVLNKMNFDASFVLEQG